MHALLNVAVMAARRAGAVLIRNLVKLEKLKVEVKGHNDYVSEADRAAERAVIDVIQKHYPEHAILAEESGATGDAAPIPSGSSIRSTAPPISCTVSRFSRSR